MSYECVDLIICGLSCLLGCGQGAMRERPNAQLVLSASEREQLVGSTMHRKKARALALRARIVVACAGGVGNKIVAARQRVTPQTVSKWDARFVEQRLGVS